MISAAAVVAEARTWIDVPFQHQGRTRFGVDCIGLVLGVRKALGPLPEVDGHIPNYLRVVQDGVMLKFVQRTCEPIDKAEPGCIVMIRWPKQEYPEHIAICTGENMVHAYRRAHRVCEIGYRAQWVRWTHSFWRLPGVTYVG